MEAWIAKLKKSLNNTIPPPVVIPAREGEPGCTIKFNISDLDAAEPAAAEE